jgi:hypothetical protein
LMDMPVEEVRAEVMKLVPQRPATQIVTAGGRDKGPRTVIVERKTSRRMTAAAPRSTR